MAKATGYRVRDKGDNGSRAKEGYSFGLNRIETKGMMRMKHVSFRRSPTSSKRLSSVISGHTSAISVRMTNQLPMKYVLQTSGDYVSQRSSIEFISSTVSFGEHCSPHTSATDPLKTATDKFIDEISPICQHCPISVICSTIAAEIALDE